MAIRSNHEQNYYRIRANQSPVTHNIFGSIPNKGAFPLPVTKTGTISSDPTSSGAENQKVVFGSGTLFTQELQEGDFIYAADVARQIIAITSNTQLVLEFPFPSNVSAAALQVIRPGRFRKIIVRNTGTGNAVYQEALLYEDLVTVNENEMGLAPVTYDVSTAGMELTFELSE